MYRLFKMKPKFTPYSVETVRSNSHFSNDKARVNWVMPPVRLNRALRMPSAGLWSTAVWAKRPIKRQKKQRDMLLKLPGRPSRHGDDLSVKTALITGASSGIGEATACKLAGSGMHVLLVARRADRLEAIAAQIKAAGGQADVFCADLSQNARSNLLFKMVLYRFGGVDVLVNNAGLGYYGYTASMPWSVAEQLLQVNVAAMVQLTLLFLPEMQKRRQGHIINIGSIAGRMPNQGISMYGATKSFMDAFTTSLFRELKGSGVQVSMVRPGAVITEFYDRAQQVSRGCAPPASTLQFQLVKWRTPSGDWFNTPARWFTCQPFSWSRPGWKSSLAG